MSALSQTYFCGNGHKVFEVGHGYLPTKLPDHCVICGNGDLYCCMEWGNKDYPCGSDVPQKCIKPGIYDISKLHKIDKDTYLEWNI